MLWTLIVYFAPPFRLSAEAFFFHWFIIFLTADTGVAAAQVRNIRPTMDASCLFSCLVPCCLLSIYRDRQRGSGSDHDYFQPFFGVFHPKRSDHEPVDMGLLYLLHSL